MPAGLTLKEAKHLTGPLVYGLLDGEIIFYIGQTRSPRRRFQAHAERRSDNPRLRERLTDVGAAVRVVVLADRPADLNAAERTAIAAHEATIVNLVGADSAVWTRGSDVPWAAGTGILSPSAFALSRAGSSRAREVRARLKAMPQSDRCCFEIDLLGDIPPLHQRRFRQWLKVAGPKMDACIANAMAPA